MKMKNKFVILFIIVFIIAMLNGCGSSSENHPDSNPEPTGSQAPQEWNSLLDFKAHVFSGDLPEFNFAVFESEYSGEEEHFFVYKIEISCPELADYTPQTIEARSFIKWDGERSDRGIELVDIDFDGCADIQVIFSEGNVNRVYEYYRWNRLAGKGYGEFETMPFFEMCCYQYELFPDTKQIISYARSSALSHPRTMYQLGETQNGGWLGKYAPIRHDDQSFNNDEIVVRTFFMDKEVLSKSVPADEFDFERDTVSDNFLRFGIDNPINIEEAQNILRDEWGTVAGENGFPLGYTFEEMCLKDELSCYKFRAQWLVDNNHWSTIGFLGVTPDGEVFDAD